jgi:hypothetical protein
LAAEKKGRTMSGPFSARFLGPTCGSEFSLRSRYWAVRIARGLDSESAAFPGSPQSSTSTVKGSAVVPTNRIRAAVPLNVACMLPEVDAQEPGLLMFRFRESNENPFQVRYAWVANAIRVVAQDWFHPSRRFRTSCSCPRCGRRSDGSAGSLACDTIGACNVFTPSSQREGSSLTDLLRGYSGSRT